MHDDESTDTDIAGKWMVVSVEFQTKCIIEVERRDELISTIVDSTPKVWKFATGPLPSGLPVRQVPTPWWVLSYS